MDRSKEKPHVNTSRVEGKGFYATLLSHSPGEKPTWIIRQRGGKNRRIWRGKAEREEVSNKISKLDAGANKGIDIKSVGIISKPEHCRALVQQLNEARYKVMPLGGTPSHLPASIDAFICRTKSCSHRATDMALKEMRTGDRPVIFENGTKRVLQALADLKLGVFDPATFYTNQAENELPTGFTVPPPLTPAPNPQPPEEAPVVATPELEVPESPQTFAKLRDALEAAVAAGGFYTFSLRRRTRNECKQVYKATGLVKDRALLERAIDYIHSLNKNSVPSELTQLRKKGYHVNKFWISHGRVVGILTPKGEPFSQAERWKVAEALGLFENNLDALNASHNNKLGQVMQKAAEAPAELQPEKPKVPDDMSDLNAIMQMLHEQLTKMNIAQHVDADLALQVKVLTVHLNFGGEGAVCGQGGATAFTGSLSKVTCKTCQETNTYKTIARALELGITA